LRGKGLSGFCPVLRFCPLCGHLVAERPNSKVEIDYTENARPVEAGKAPSARDCRWITGSEFTVPYNKKSFDIRGYLRSLGEEPIKIEAFEKSIKEKEWNDLWPQIETLRVEDEHRMWDKITAEMNNLTSIGREKTRQALIELGEQWASRGRRAQGSIDSIRSLIIATVAEYYSQHRVDDVGRSQISGLQIKGIDHFMFTIGLPDVGPIGVGSFTTILILRAEKDLFCCVYSKPQDQRNPSP